MTTATAAVRDSKTDHLPTADNAALLLIDYQPSLVEGTNSQIRETLINNVVALTKAAKLFDLPIILSSIGVNAGYQQDIIPELKEILPDVDTIDRRAVNAWEEEAFRKAVEATGRRKLIIAGLWTEVLPRLPGPRHAPRRL